MITRRATTAASRRRVTAADIFTACYTTILGTAAVLDAHRKGNRQKDLDEKLDKARAALSNLAIQEAPDRNEAPARESSSDHPASSETPIGTSQWGNGMLSTSTTALLSELGNLAASTYRSTARSWRQHQVDWAAVEAAILLEEQDPGLEIQEPNSEAHMGRTTHTIETLIRAGPYHPSYVNPRSDPEWASEERVLLSDSFRSAFNKAGDVTEVVGKICHNLLVSSPPPNIHNYNVLIAGFNRIQRPDLAQPVVDSYLADTRWPATQQTIVCLLNHAVATNDIEQFRNVVRRMRGVAEDGLHFRIVSKNAIVNSEGLLWAETNCASRKHAWVERAKRGNDVFDTLIRGLLKGLAKNFENFKALVELIYTNSPTEMARSIFEMFYSLFDLSGLPYTRIAGGVKKSLRMILRKFKSLQIVTRAQIELDGIEDASSEVMGSLGTGSPYNQRVSRALETLAEKPHDSQTDIMPAEGLGGILGLAALARRCQSLEEKTLRIEAHAKVSIIYAITGVHCDTRSRLPPVDWQHRQRHERYPAVFHAVRSISTKDLLPGKNNLRRQFLRGLPNRKLAKQFKDLAWWQNLEFGTLMSLYQDGPNASKRNIERLRTSPRKLEEEEANVTVTGSSMVAPALAPIPEQFPFASGGLAVHEPTALSLHAAGPSPIMISPERQLQSHERSQYHAAAGMG
ncbi:hypothetical protein PG994_001531 [Apiospora phragmitis]|uniref:Pentatricopeptide repeat domain-containing protein n=1 Tax=Apiospora phragmitis TaxID=2905665 RepID=A0ABR1WTR3_9PEZI